MCVCVCVCVCVCAYVSVCMYVCIYILTHVFKSVSSLHVDFAIVKSKYAEMIACLPEDYETTIVSLQSYLTDSEICEILSMTSNHNQKTLNYLILKLKSKEDLLDFCDCLENVKEAHPVLQLIIQQIKKGNVQVCNHAMQQKIFKDKLIHCFHGVFCSLKK